MKTVSAGFKAMLASKQQLLACDLYTITLLSGTILYYTDAPQDITLGGHTYLHASYANTVPGFNRGGVKLALGLQVESLEVDMLYDLTTRIEGTTPGAFANAGGFDGARLKVDKFLTTDFTVTTNGVVNLFTGVVNDISAGSGKVTLSVSSDLVYLNAAFPRNYFLPQDNNALFDAGNGLNKAAWAVSGSVGSATKTTITDAALTQAAGWFALGYIVITSGVNAGLTRTVKDFSGGVLTLLYPLPTPCAAGDTFTAYPGYDRTLAQATTKFNNVSHFRGFPFVPTPEVIELGQNSTSPTDNSGAGAGVGNVGRGGGGQNGKFLQR
jgi:uncharacterized phage protein (TIGR02218 family)